MEISGLTRRFLQGADCWNRAGKCVQPRCAKPCCSGNGCWGCHKCSRAFPSLQNRSQNFPSWAVKGVFICSNSLYLFPLPALPSWLPAESKTWSPVWSARHRHITSSHESSQKGSEIPLFGVCRLEWAPNSGTPIPPQEHLVLLAGEGLALIPLKLGGWSSPECLPSVPDPPSVLDPPFSSMCSLHKSCEPQAVSGGGDCGLNPIPCSGCSGCS